MQSKSLYIAEKPSVAKEFAKVLNVETDVHRMAILSQQMQL